jgi:RNA polymerase primary sigma factor
MRQLKITKSITNRESLSLDKYLHEISKFGLITADEEVELARRIKNGDAQAIDKLTRSNLRFVVSVAKQYQNHGLSLPDLINEGNLGLIKAAEKYDETRGFKFISYAVWWIRQSIMQAINEQSRIVRLPLNQVNSLTKCQKILSKFEQEFERLPSIDELSDIMDMPKEKLADTLSNAGRHLSYDAPFSEEGDCGTLIDVLENKENPFTDIKLLNESLSTEIDRVLTVLSHRESIILKMSYGIGYSERTIEEIATHLKLTRERVRQIKEKSLRKLRDSDKCTMLKDYLG